MSYINGEKSGSSEFKVDKFLSYETFERGEDVFCFGDYGDKFYIIVEG